MTGAQLGSSAPLPIAEPNGTPHPPTKTPLITPQTPTTPPIVKALSPNGILPNGAVRSEVRNVSHAADPHSKMPTQQLPTTNGTKHDHRSELEKNLVAIDLKNLKENSNLVKNLQSYGLGSINGGIETNYTNGITPVSTTQTINTQKLPQPTPVAIPLTSKPLHLPLNAAGEDTDDSKSPIASDNEEYVNFN